MTRLRINTDPLRVLAVRIASPQAHRVGAARAGAEHVRLTQEVFANRGRPLADWPDKAVPVGVPTNPRTRKRRVDPTPRLQDTGALVQSIAARPTENGYEIGPGPLPYAAVHQFGATITISTGMRRALRAMGFRVRNSTRTIRIPPRPYIGLPTEWEAQLTEAYLSATVSDATEGLA